MEVLAKTSMLIMLVVLHAANALEAKKVLHIPEKIIGGVIDIVQSHKNKQTQQNFYQNQGQQQIQQGYGWNSGYQGQNQVQYQYGNGYQQPGQNYPQGGYVNYGQGSGYQQYGGSQMQNQGQYQNYPSGGQFQGQNQQSTSFDNQQYQNQAQNNQGQTQVQNQLQNQNSQFQNQNQQSNLNYQGNQYGNQQLSHNQGSYGFNQQSNHGNYGTFGYPQGQVTQTTFQNHQSSQFGTAGGPSYGSAQNFQMTNGQPAPGPTCVCQAWTKPVNDPLNSSPSQRSEETTETPK